MSEIYKSKDDKALAEAREELARLFKEREELDIRIAKQQRRLGALATLVDDSEETDQIMELNLGGLTEAIRTALRAAGSRGLTPGEVTTRLIQLYFPVNEYKNFRASLITVLKRLVASGEVRTAIHDVQEGRDQSVYQWVGGIKNRFEGRYKGRFGSRLKGRYGGPPVTEDT
jgi:hypothetical protein